MVEHLFSLRSGLPGDAIADLHRRIKNTSVIADLSETAKAADGGGGGECLQIAVVHLCSQAGRADLVKADVLRKLQGKPVGTDGAMESNEHLALLRVADALPTHFER